MYLYGIKICSCHNYIYLLKQNKNVIPFTTHEGRHKFHPEATYNDRNNTYVQIIFIEGDIFNAYAVRFSSKLAQLN